LVLLFIYIHFSAEHVLEVSGISVAPPSHYSRRFLSAASPTVSSKKPSPESRQRCASEDEDDRDNAQFSEDEANLEPERVPVKSHAASRASHPVSWMSLSPTFSVSRGHDCDVQLPAQDELTASHGGRAGSHTRPSYEGIFFITIRYLIDIRIDICSLVEQQVVSKHNSVS
jgi:hypothetical protein